MSEEIKETEATDEVVATPAAEAPAETPAAEAPAATEEVAAEEAPKKEEKKRDIFAELAGGEEELKIHKAKKSKNVQTGIVHVTATFNNTLVSVTDFNGNAIGWSSAGKMGFKGSRKSTAYAAQVVSQDACRQAMSATVSRLLKFALKAQVLVVNPQFVQRKASVLKSLQSKTSQQYRTTAAVRRKHVAYNLT